MRKWYLVDKRDYSIWTDEIARPVDVKTDEDMEGYVRTVLRDAFFKNKTPQERRRYLDSTYYRDYDYDMSVCFAEMEDGELDFNSVTDYYTLEDVLKKGELK